MRKSILVAVLTIALFSCKKEEIRKPGIGGVFKEDTVFPLKEGDIWRVDIVSYNSGWPVPSQNGELNRNFQTYYDTIKAPQKRDDGREYYSFFWEFYTLLDDNTVQTSLTNRDWWGNEYPGEYIWFKDVKKVDTLSLIKFYSDVSPENAVTVAYPEDTVINGLTCKHTRVVYFSNYNNEDHYTGERVVYFSKGNGPVYEIEYSSSYENNNLNNPMEIVKIKEKYYKQVVFSKD